MTVNWGEIAERYMEWLKVVRQAYLIKCFQLGVLEFDVAIKCFEDADDLVLRGKFTEGLHPAKVGEDLAVDQHNEEL